MLCGEGGACPPPCADGRLVSLLARWLLVGQPDPPLSLQNFHLIDFNVLAVTAIVLARRLIGAIVKEVKEVEAGAPRPAGWALTCCKKSD